MKFPARIRAALELCADPAKADGMRAYMRDRFPFLGVQTPMRRQAARELIREFAGDPIAAAMALWEEPEREFQYVACDLLALHAAHLPAGTLDDLLTLVSDKPWWDTVDALAHVVGTLVGRFSALSKRMDRLVDDEDLWRRRVALLHQLGRKAETDTGRLFDYCLRRAGETEFFIRKAIGWALRDYAWHDPAAVREFLRQHGDKFAPLTLREAAKNLCRR